MNISNRLFSFLLVLLALAPIGGYSELAYAQATTSPRIEDFYVDSDDALEPGALLTFTLEGTPRGKASVRISGIARIIPLKEVEKGIYEGSYTLSRTNKIAASNTVRATLKVRARSTSKTYSLPWENSSASTPPPSVTLVPTIERFTVTPIDKIEPGADLKFAMIGTPGAKAYVSIDGVTSNVPMQEVKGGHYEGSYTIRRLDNFPPAVNIIGTLEANDRTIRARLNQALIADAKSPVIKNLFPREGETVVANNLTSISGTFDDSGGVGVDIKSVKIMVGGKDVTQGATITPQFFDYRVAGVQPGTYQVEVTAKDLSGNAVRRAWTFVVAPQTVLPTLPLEILSHANNAQVSGNTIEVRGRTAPDANIDVRVQGISSIAGLFGVRQQIDDQSLRADANGDFVFSFRPQYPLPGTRYEISVNAIKGDLNRETNLILFQQK